MVKYKIEKLIMLLDDICYGKNEILEWMDKFELIDFIVEQLKDILI